MRRLNLVLEEGGEGGEGGGGREGALARTPPPQRTVVHVHAGSEGGGQVNAVSGAVRTPFHPAREDPAALQPLPAPEGVKRVFQPLRRWGPDQTDGNGQPVTTGASPSPGKAF